MFQRNLDVREAKGKIPIWVIAERLGVHENTLNGWLRKEMDQEKKKRVSDAIIQINTELKEYGVSKITKDSRPAV